jgi:ATP-binding cassette subfamily B protein
MLTLCKTALIIKRFTIYRWGRRKDKMAAAKTKRINIKLLLRLWKYLGRYKKGLFFAIFLSVLSNTLSLLGPMLSGLAIDEVTAGTGAVNFSKVFFYCGLMIGFYVLSSALSYTLSTVMINITQKVVVAMRRDIFNKMAELPVPWFDNFQAGDIISRFSYDIDTIAASLSSDTVQIFSSVITVVGSFILMLLISPKLLIIFIVTIPVSILTTRAIASKVRPLFRRRSEKLGEMNGYAEEMIGGHKTIKAYGTEESVIKRFNKKNDEASEAYYRAEYYGTLSGPSMNFINNISISLVSLFGVLLYLTGGITLGNVSSFTLYSRKFSGPINEFANILNEFQSSFAAAERVFKIMDEKPEPADKDGAAVLPETTGRVSMENVTFSYKPGNPVLKDVSFEAPAGKTIAIVGPTGGGKTTLINLLMRFYEPESGMICIDGRDIRDMTRKSLRLSYSMVLQDTWLFYGSVYDNIAYSKEGATAAEVEAAAKAAKIDGFIATLPGGYNSIIDEEGMNISKGQKQLITIARAMLSDAKMLILDEATSNVDTRTERLIQGAMLELMKGKTCFVIAHRLSTIVNADIIFVVKNGQIIEKGTHAELINRNSYYSELYMAQFE